MLRLNCGEWKVVNNRFKGVGCFEIKWGRTLATDKWSGHGKPPYNAEKGQDGTGNSLPAVTPRPGLMESAEKSYGSRRRAMYQSVGPYLTLPKDLDGSMTCLTLIVQPHALYDGFDWALVQMKGLVAAVLAHKGLGKGWSVTKSLIGEVRLLMPEPLKRC